MKLSKRYVYKGNIGDKNAEQYKEIGAKYGVVWKFLTFLTFCKNFSMLSMSSFQVQLLYRNLFLEASKINKQSYDNKLNLCVFIFYLSLSLRPNKI